MQGVGGVGDVVVWGLGSLRSVLAELGEKGVWYGIGRVECGME